MEIKHELKKISNGRYAFIMTQGDLTRTEEISKQMVKDEYEKATAQRQQGYEALQKQNKQIKENGIFEADEELTHFIELAEKASKYQNNKNLIEQKALIETGITNLTREILDIEKVLPELMRAKK